MKGNILKNGNGLNMYNIIVMLSLLVTIALAYSKMSTTVDMINQELQKKADKEVVDVHFIYIQQQLDEIKELIEEK